MKTPRSTNLLGWRQALPLLALLAAGCLQLQSDKEQREAARQKVMDRHNELMDRMDELTLLRQQLRQVPDTAEAGRRSRALLAADAAMMDWMHQYHNPADTMRQERALAYLAAQQRRIDSVGTLMQQSVDAAQALLKGQ
ncbi:hypothetical protein EJV47_07645 [Hymenobacter gummosus]|uniref:Viral A-type inclusion protein n=1 Tax=Hymenobacter gummosus TaxID=1776032 RepID=A0A3S0K751_9BACT|nr:hypothetical protein [Hymenobacter gummosus]RTQ51661.1 hypothetical protein EJV47_07645 [Hymenobacter gummosus]